MKRSGPIQRRTPLKRSTPKQKRRRGIDPETRTAVFLRDKGCKGKEVILDLPCWGRLDPHHILRKSQGGQNTADNLVTLCRAHHDWVHAYPEASRNLGLLRRSQTKETTNDNDY